MANVLPFQRQDMQLPEYFVIFDQAGVFIEIFVEATELDGGLPACAHDPPPEETFR